MPFVYATINEDGEKVYHGLCIDMMDKLSEMLGCSYRISTSEDRRIGGQDEDGNWFGLIGDLVNRVSNIDTYKNCDTL